MRDKLKYLIKTTREKLEEAKKDNNNIDYLYYYEILLILNDNINIIKIKKKDEKDEN